MILSTGARTSLLETHTETFRASDYQVYEKGFHPGCADREIIDTTSRLAGPNLTRYQDDIARKPDQSPISIEVNSLVAAPGRPQAGTDPEGRSRTDRRTVAVFRRGKWRICDRHLSFSIESGD